MIECLSKYVGIIGGLGTFFAALVAWWTLREIKRQRISAQKPQILFNVNTVGVVSGGDILGKVALIWNDINKLIENKVLFQMINGGKDLAKNISFEFKLNIDLFIERIKEKDIDNEMTFRIDNNWIVIESKFNSINYKTPLTVNIGQSSRLEYLLPRHIQEKPSGFAIPDEYLALISCLFYLSIKTQKNILMGDIPKLLVKTTYEDVSGNSERLYHYIQATHFDTHKFLFNITKMTEKEFTI